MSVEFNRQDLDELRRLIEVSGNVVITCHVSPDGDALGSSLGMAHILKGMGKTVTVITPDESPRIYRIFPGFRDTVKAWSSYGVRAERIVAQADLILCLDYNALYRLSRLEPHVRGARAKQVLIDHHKEPEDFAAVSFSYPLMSSTCELCFHILDAMGWADKVDTTAATCFMGGIITDTGGFHYNSNSPDLYRVVADLMERGVDKDWLMRCLVDTHSASSMRLESFAIAEKMELFADDHAALITLDRDELNRFDYKKGDTEGLVNKPLAIPGIVYSCYLREETGYIKVSMRSLGDFPVDLLCKRHYNGGGHLNASGGEFTGTLDEAARIFRESLAENRKYITEEALQYARR